MTTTRLAPPHDRPLGSLRDEPGRFDGGLHSVARGAYAWLQPNGGLGESNAGVVVGDGSALLIDTLWDLPLTQRLLDAIHGEIGTPITTLVNTHADGDHTWGNQLVAGAEIVASHATARHFGDERPTSLRLLQRLGAVESHVARLRHRRRVTSALERAFAPFDFRNIRLTPPTRTFSGSLELDVGGRLAILHEVGPAHSAGDTIVHVPDVGLVYAADILMRGGIWPVMWAGPITNWITGLDLVLRMEPDVVVPGHGPVCSTREVREMWELMVWIESGASRLLARGHAPERAARELLSSADAHGGPWEDLGMPEALFITVSTVDRHRRGGVHEPSRIQRLRTLAQAAAFARSVT